MITNASSLHFTSHGRPFFIGSEQDRLQVGRVGEKQINNRFS